MEERQATLTVKVVVTADREKDFSEGLYDAVVGEGSLHVDVLEITSITHEEIFT